MIVTPTPDVVLDVLEAADPVAQRAATAKLDALKLSDVDFSSTMAAEAGKATAAKGLPNADAPTRVIKAANSGEVYRKFEAFVLQVFVETMLPQNTQDLFGKGTAGGIWRSMLAEQLGNQLAQGKGIGIARQLAAAHPAATDGGPDKAG
ncbi:rod-binding protein [Bradyrhizobium sp. WSM 1704]|uniref:rod-binding protein n=1 Tax=Bradyrhizobium semiaridum TaxID=2821404 RepID=UPI001CE39C1C|nr:rod-binding protein [Bradyrhizobium semiaridum]MCA6123809.1 rod-binding protein [Bradyrhizobium semiaridum]